MPLGLTPGINGVLGTNLLSAFHQHAQLLATVSLGPILLDGLTGNIVRWRGFHLFPATVPDQQMSITHARIKRKLSAAQLVLKRPDQLGRVGAGDVVGRKVKHGFGSIGFTAQGHQIAPKRNIFRSQVHTHTGRFNGRASGVVLTRVIAEQAHGSDVAARGIALGNRLGEAIYAVGRNIVHMRRPRVLKRRFPAEFIDRPVRHAIALENDIFHTSHPSRNPWTGAACAPARRKSQPGHCDNRPVIQSAYWRSARPPRANALHGSAA